MNSKIAKDVILRSFALFLVTALPAIGAGSFIGVAPINATVIAGDLAVTRIIPDLAKAFLDDGKLTQEEVDAIFKKANKKEESK